MVESENATFNNKAFVSDSVSHSKGVEKESAYDL